MLLEAKANTEAVEQWVMSCRIPHLSLPSLFPSVPSYLVLSLRLFFSGSYLVLSLRLFFSQSHSW
jgi:hypothetical protein